MVASITAENLTKRFSRTQPAALDNLNLDIKAGEVYGYLGANGAGKSTTIRLLMNFIQPTSGSAHIAGLDVVKDAVAVKRHVGYLAGDVALYAKTTGKELLDYLAALKGGVDIDYRRKLETRFEAEMDKPISMLSKGNRQKIGILLATVHRPDVLILDEPTSGLDPLMQEAFYDTIRESQARGTAVLMSSHNLAEATALCDRIGILKHGKLIREQVTADQALVSSVTFRVVLTRPTELTRLRKTPHLTFISQEGGTIGLVQPTGTIAQALKSLATFDIRALTTQHLSLEDEFLGYYEDTV
jgi:ABC-2 type transport system ATP-binding protein